jgi:hypothetical protein
MSEKSYLKEIEGHYNLASAAAEKELIRLARRAMRKSPVLIEFVMGMGTWFFVDKNDDYIHEDDSRMCVRDVSDFMEEWDEVFKLTGNLMRFSVDSEVVRNW